MTRLEVHAELELRRAGLFDEDSDYAGAIGEQVMKLIRALDGCHSGGSMAITLAAFERVARFRTLMPITSSPDEWMDVGGLSGEPLWQNRRNPACFSNDAGATYYDIDADDDRALKTSEPAP